mmetsp:Transcript_10258/g.40087  ORF Transcript_10258/g.40087 Transcript_10258/m.40087 type:complete len:207 (-) Transcript_10258:166-786(-)
MRPSRERPVSRRRWRPRASRGTRQPRARGPSPRIPCRRRSRGRTRALSAARVPRDRSTTRLARAEDRSRAPPWSPPDVPPASRHGPACRRRGARTRALAKGRPRSSQSRCISDERRGFDAARGRVERVAAGQRFSGMAVKIVLFHALRRVRAAHRLAEGRRRPADVGSRHSPPRLRLERAPGLTRRPLASFAPRSEFTKSSVLQQK